MDIKTAFQEAIDSNRLEIVLNKTVIDKLDTQQQTNRHTGKHALKTYKGIVEFPHHRGGGIVWLKSVYALRNYEAKNYKVVWL
jgi:hypothetical protein